MSGRNTSAGWRNHDRVCQEPVQKVKWIEWQGLVCNWGRPWICVLLFFSFWLSLFCVCYTLRPEMGAAISKHECRCFLKQSPAHEGRAAGSVLSAVVKVFISRSLAASVDWSFLFDRSLTAHFTTHPVELFCFCALTHASSMCLSLSASVAVCPKTVLGSFAAVWQTLQEVFCVCVCVFYGVMRSCSQFCSISLCLSFTMPAVVNRLQQESCWFWWAIHGESTLSPPSSPLSPPLLFQGLCNTFPQFSPLSSPLLSFSFFFPPVSAESDGRTQSHNAILLSPAAHFDKAVRPNPSDGCSGVRCTFVRLYVCVFMSLHTWMCILMCSELLWGRIFTFMSYNLPFTEACVPLLPAYT